MYSIIFRAVSDLFDCKRISQAFYEKLDISPIFQSFGGVCFLLFRKSENLNVNVGIVFKNIDDLFCTLFDIVHPRRKKIRICFIFYRYVFLCEKLPECRRIYFRYVSISCLADRRSAII